MKTPRQIAKEYSEKASKPYVIKNDRINISSSVYDAVRQAIEADRAQRAEDLAVLADAAASWVTELTDYVIPSASNEVDGAIEHEAERDAIQAALGRYLDEQEQS